MNNPEQSNTENGYKKASIIVSAGEVTDIQVCSALHGYNYVLKYSRNIFGDKGEDIERGDLFHRLLDFYYSAKIEGKDFTIEELEEYGKNQATSLNLSPEETLKQIGYIKEYIDYYRHEDWKPLASEAPFLTPIHEEENFIIYVKGKADLFVLNTRTNSKIVVDHKTNKKAFTPSFRTVQFKLYCLAFGVREFVYNQIVQADKPASRFNRYYNHYSSTQLEEFRNDLIHWVGEIIKNYARVEIGEDFPHNESSCVKFNNRKCTYYDVCNTTPDNRLYRLNTLFGAKKDYDIFEG